MKSMDRQFGRSVFLMDGLDTVESIFQEMQEDRQHIAFTSFQLPEYPLTLSDMQRVIHLAKSYEVDLIPDIAHDRLTEEAIVLLQKAGLTYIRMDEFLDEALLARCANAFTLVVNASTLTKEQLDLVRKYQNQTTVIACHNYYPKSYTGLSLQRLKTINDRLKQWGVTIVAFIPGDKPLRAPLYEGLPTVEEHRHCDKRLAIIQLLTSGVDWVLVGDITASCRTRLIMKDASQNRVRLTGQMPLHLQGITYYDRIDASDYLFRMTGTRGLPLFFSLASSQMRIPGEIYQATREYGRYCGEIEVIKQPIPADSRQQKIGELDASEITILQQLPDGMGIFLEMAD